MKAPIRTTETALKTMKTTTTHPPWSRDGCRRQLPCGFPARHARSRHAATTKAPIPVALHPSGPDGLLPEVTAGRARLPPGAPTPAGRQLRQARAKQLAHAAAGSNAVVARRGPRGTLRTCRLRLRRLAAPTQCGRRHRRHRRQCDGPVGPLRLQRACNGTARLYHRLPSNCGRVPSASGPGRLPQALQAPQAPQAVGSTVPLVRRTARGTMAAGPPQEPRSCCASGDRLPGALVRSGLRSDG